MVLALNPSNARSAVTHYATLRLLALTTDSETAPPNILLRSLKMDSNLSNAGGTSGRALNTASRCLMKYSDAVYRLNLAPREGFVRNFSSTYRKSDVWGKHMDDDV